MDDAFPSVTAVTPFCTVLDALFSVDSEIEGADELSRAAVLGYN